jgi:hypothetical protein
MDEKTKELLEKQLELLSKQSIDFPDFASNNTHAMVEIATFLESQKSMPNVFRRKSDKEISDTVWEIWNAIHNSSLEQSVGCCTDKSGSTPSGKLD